MTIEKFLADCADCVDDPSALCDYALERNQRTKWARLAKLVTPFDRDSLIVWAETVGSIDPFVGAPFGWSDLNRLQHMVAIVQFARAITKLSKGTDYVN